MKPVPASLADLVAGKPVDPAPFAGTSLSGWAAEDPHDLARETVFVEALRELGPKLAAASVRPVVLGGVALWGREYPKPGSRRAHDIDLFVSPQERDACTAVLSAAGFSSPPSHPMVWQRGPVEIDLHTHWLNDARRHVFDLVTTIDAGDVWSRGEPLPCCDVDPWRRPGPEDLWLLLALHAVKHEFERINLVLDLKLLLDNHQPDTDLGRQLLAQCAPAINQLGLEPIGESGSPRLARSILLERPARPFLAGLRLLASLSSSPVTFWWRLFWGTGEMNRESSALGRWTTGLRKLSGSSST